MSNSQPASNTSNLPSSSHKLNAQACVINCIDFRIQETFYMYLQQHHLLGKSDIIELAGSSRDLVKPIKPQDKDEFIRNLVISIKLHSPKHILVFDHQDCGGYAQDNTIPQGLNLQQDKELHTKYLTEAKNILKKLHPNIKISTFYITLNHEIFEM